MCDQACWNYLKQQFCYFLQYLKKEVSDEVDFLHPDKQESFFNKSPKNSKFVMSLEYIKKEVIDKVDFLDADKHQKFPTVWFQHFGHCNFLQGDLIIIDEYDQAFSKYWSKFAIYLYLKKEVTDGVHFLHADKLQSFFELALLFLMEVVRHVQSIQNRKLVIYNDCKMRSIFPLSQWQRNLILLFLWCKILCKTWKKICEFHLYCWDHVWKVNECCLVDCFHYQFMVSTQIMVHNYCFSKCKRFAACGGLLMALCVIFFKI